MHIHVHATITINIFIISLHYSVKTTLMTWLQVNLILVRGKLWWFFEGQLSSNTGVKITWTESRKFIFFSSSFLKYQQKINYFHFLIFFFFWREREHENSLPPWIWSSLWFGMSPFGTFSTTADDSLWHTQVTDCLSSSLEDTRGAK